MTLHNDIVPIALSSFPPFMRTCRPIPEHRTIKMLSPDFNEYSPHFT